MGDQYSNIDMTGNSLSSFGLFAQDKMKYTVDNIDVLNDSNASQAVKTLDTAMKKQLECNVSRIGAQAMRSIQRCGASRRCE